MSNTESHRSDVCTRVDAWLGAMASVLVGVHNLRTMDAECGTMKYTSDVTMRGSAKQRAVSLRITGRCASARAKSALCLLHAIILVFFPFVRRYETSGGSRLPSLISDLVPTPRFSNNP